MDIKLRQPLIISKKKERTLSSALIRTYFLDIFGFFSMDTSVDIRSCMHLILLSKHPAIWNCWTRFKNNFEGSYISGRFVKEYTRKTSIRHGGECRRRIGPPKFVDDGTLPRIFHRKIGNPKNKLLFWNELPRLINICALLLFLFS